MLPYFRSMEAFFNLSLPKSWADLSDPQLLFLLLHDLLAIEVKIEIVHCHFLVKDIHSRDNLLTLAEQLRHLFRCSQCFLYRKLSKCVTHFCVTCDAMCNAFLAHRVTLCPLLYS